MSMGRRDGKQPALWLASKDVATSPGHKFYEALNRLLEERFFDRHVESLCAEHYAGGGEGRPSIPPGVYFRMLLIGYFEGIESERGICWRCADSLSLRTFLRLLPTEATPEHSSLSRIRRRLPLTVYTEVFRFVLSVVESQGLLKGKQAGVDSTYLRADASMRSIVRRDTGVSYQDYLKELAKAEGIAEPTAEDCRRLDKKRKGRRTSNTDWQSATDADARIQRLKDGRTRLAYKPEHVVDLQTGAILAAEVYHANVADTASITSSLEAARANVLAVVEGSEEDTAKKDDDDDNQPPSGATTSRPNALGADEVEVVADKGYHKARTLRDLEERGFRPYIPERKQKGQRRWGDKGGTATARAFHANRSRVQRPKSKAMHRKRGELLERTFAHVCETGAHRRTRLRGLDNMRKRYVLQTAAANLGLVMRTLFGSGTPREMANRAREVTERCFAAFVILWCAMAHVVRRSLQRNEILPASTDLTVDRRFTTVFSTGC
jgi:transposase